MDCITNALIISKFIYNFHAVFSYRKYSIVQFVYTCSPCLRTCGVKHTPSLHDKRLIVSPAHLFPSRRADLSDTGVTNNTANCIAVIAVTEPPLMSLLTPVLFLLWQVKMSALEKDYVSDSSGNDTRWTRCFDNYTFTRGLYLIGWFYNFQIWLLLGIVFWQCGEGLETTFRLLAFFPTDLFVFFVFFFLCSFQASANHSDETI